MGGGAALTDDGALEALGLAGSAGAQSKDLAQGPGVPVDELLHLGQLTQSTSSSLLV